jgi:mono/diheme cytochrome c family protein
VPSPQVIRGAALYKTYCSSCHGDDPEDGTQGVYKGLTAEVIEAAYRRVPVMQPLDAMLSPANDADIAAFIESRVRAR